MQLKSVASLFDASVGTRQQFEEHLDLEKKCPVYTYQETKNMKR